MAHIATARKLAAQIGARIVKPTETLRRPAYRILEAVVNEDIGRTRWPSVGFARTERAARTFIALAQKLGQLGAGCRVVDVNGKDVWFDTAEEDAALTAIVF